MAIAPTSSSQVRTAISPKNEPATPTTEASTAAEAQQAGWGPSARGGQPATHTVVAKESLWRIAARELGDGSRWKELYELNKDIIADPNLIHPGQVLKLPRQQVAAAPAAAPAAAAPVAAPAAAAPVAAPAAAAPAATPAAVENGAGSTAPEAAEQPAAVVQPAATYTPEARANAAEASAAAAAATPAEDPNAAAKAQIEAALSKAGLTTPEGLTAYRDYLTQNLKNPEVAPPSEEGKRLVLSVVDGLLQKAPAAAAPAGAASAAAGTPPAATEAAAAPAAAAPAAPAEAPKEGPIASAISATNTLLQTGTMGLQATNALRRRSALKTAFNTSFRVNTTPAGMKTAQQVTNAARKAVVKATLKAPASGLEAGTLRQAAKTATEKVLAKSKVGGVMVGEQRGMEAAVTKAAEKYGMSTLSKAAGFVTKYFPIIGMVGSGKELYDLATNAESTKEMSKTDKALAWVSSTTGVVAGVASAVVVGVGLAGITAISAPVLAGIGAVGAVSFAISNTAGLASLAKGLTEGGIKLAQQYLAPAAAPAPAGAQG